MTRSQSTAEGARNAMVAGLLASGISVNGLQPSHNPQVASQMFTTATNLDPEMCDAWLARMLAGEHSIDVLAGAWSSSQDLRLGNPPARRHRPAVSPRGLRRVVPAAGGHQRRVTGMCVRRRPGRSEALRGGGGTARRRRPRQPFEEELVNYVRGVLYFRTGRWPDVLSQFPEGKVWRQPELKAAGAAMATTALASLGVFEEALPARPGRRRRRTGCRVRPTSPSTPRACACGTWAARMRPSSCCAGCIRGTRSSPRPAKRWTTPTTG